ncbi:MAG: TRAP transporter substrate-binding protein [Cohaesibacteraceae bacterium]|nr:TRAP transporter substrate-binding protein [Cohaesibacteraceae bacterium]
MSITRRSFLSTAGNLVAASATVSIIGSKQVYANTGTKITIQVNTTMKPGGSEDAGIKKFAGTLEKLAPGKFDVVPFMSGQLGGENSILELLNIGETQISLTGGNWRTQYGPTYDPVSIPFLFPNGNSVDEYMGTVSGNKLTTLAENLGGIVHMGTQARAPRHMTSNRAIHTPADLEGLRLRLPAIPVWIDIWSSMGVQTVVVPAPEIFLAMQTGQVDAHENTLASPYFRKLYEVQSHLILTGHVHFPWHWVASKSWLDTLSATDRATVEQAVQIARVEGSMVEAQKDIFYLNELKKKGMKVIEPDVAAFKEAAQPAIDTAIGNLADGVLADVNSAIAAAG